MSRLLPALFGLLVAASAFGAATALDGSGPAAPAPASSPVDGGAVFARMGCGGCHAFAAANARGHIGPDLDEALGAHDRASLARQIVDPRQSAGYAQMPAGFGERLTAEELSALVTFLLTRRRGGPRPAR